MSATKEDETVKSSVNRKPARLISDATMKQLATKPKDLENYPFVQYSNFRGLALVVNNKTWTGFHRMLTDIETCNESLSKTEYFTFECQTKPNVAGGQQWFTISADILTGLMQRCPKLRSLSMTKMLIEDGNTSPWQDIARYGNISSLSLSSVKISNKDFLAMLEAKNLRYISLSFHGWPGDKPVVPGDVEPFCVVSNEDSTMYYGRTHIPNYKLSGIQLYLARAVHVGKSQGCIEFNEQGQPLITPKAFSFICDHVIPPMKLDIADADKDWIAKNPDKYSLYNWITKLHVLCFLNKMYKKKIITLREVGKHLGIGTDAVLEYGDYGNDSYQADYRYIKIKFGELESICFDRIPLAMGPYGVSQFQILKQERGVKRVVELNGENIAKYTQFISQVLCNGLGLRSGVDGILSAPNAGIKELEGKKENSKRPGLSEAVLGTIISTYLTMPELISVFATCKDARNAVNKTETEQAKKDKAEQPGVQGASSASSGNIPGQSVATNKDEKASAGAAATVTASASSSTAHGLLRTAQPKSGSAGTNLSVSPGGSSGVEDRSQQKTLKAR